jgi:hypothetical protein
MAPRQDVLAATHHLMLAARAPLAAVQEVVEAAERLLTTRLAAMKSDQQQQQQQPAQQAAAARRQLLLQLRRAEAALSSAQARLGGAIKTFAAQAAHEEQRAAELRVQGVSNIMRQELQLSMHTTEDILGQERWQQQQLGLVWGVGDANLEVFAQSQQLALHDLYTLLTVHGKEREGAPGAERSEAGTQQQQGHHHQQQQQEGLGKQRELRSCLRDAMEELKDVNDALQAQEPASSWELLDCLERELLASDGTAKPNFAADPRLQGLWDKYGHKRWRLLEGVTDTVRRLAAMMPASNRLHHMELWPGRGIQLLPGDGDSVQVTFGPRQTPTPSPTPPTTSPASAALERGGSGSIARPGSSSSSSSRSSMGPSPVLRLDLAQRPQQQQQQQHAGHPPRISIPASISPTSGAPPPNSSSSRGLANSSSGGIAARDRLSLKVSAVIDAMMPDLPPQPSPLDAAGKQAFRAKMTSIVSLIHNLAQLEKAHPQPQSALPTANIQRLKAAAEELISRTHGAMGPGVYKKPLPFSPVFEPRMLASELMQHGALLSPAAQRVVAEVVNEVVNLPRPAFASGVTYDDSGRGSTPATSRGVVAGGAAAAAYGPHPPGLGPMPDQHPMSPPGLQQMRPMQQVQQQQQGQSRLYKGLMPGFLSRPNSSAGAHSSSAHGEGGSSAGLAGGGGGEAPTDRILQMRGGAPSEATLSSHSSSRAGSWCSIDPGSPHPSGGSSSADGEQQEQQQEEAPGSLGPCLRLCGGVPSENGSTASSSSVARPQRPAGAAGAGSLSSIPATADVVLQAWAFTLTAGILLWPHTVTLHMQHAMELLLAGELREGVVLATASAVNPALTSEEQVDLTDVLSDVAEIHYPWLLQEPALSPPQWQALQAWWQGLPQPDRLQRLRVARDQLSWQDQQQQLQATNSLIVVLWDQMVGCGGAAGLAPADQVVTPAAWLVPAPSSMPASDEIYRLVMAELARQLIAVSRVKALMEAAVAPYLPCWPSQQQQQQPGSAAAAAGGESEVEEVCCWVAQLVLAATMLQVQARLLLQATCLASAAASPAAARDADDHVLAICCNACHGAPFLSTQTAPWLQGWRDLVPLYLTVLVGDCIPRGPAARLPALLMQRCSVEARQAAVHWMQRLIDVETPPQLLSPREQQEVLLTGAELALWLVQAHLRGIPALAAEAVVAWRPLAENYARLRSPQVVAAADSSDSAQAEETQQRAGRAGRQVAGRRSGGPPRASPSPATQQQQQGGRRIPVALLSDSDEDEDRHLGQQLQPGASGDPSLNDAAQESDGYHSCPDSGSDNDMVGPSDEEEVYGTPLGSAASSSGSAGGSGFLARSSRHPAGDPGRSGLSVLGAPSWPPEEAAQVEDRAPSPSIGQAAAVDWFPLYGWLAKHGFDFAAVEQCVLSDDVEGLHEQVRHPEAGGLQAWIW